MLAPVCGALVLISVVLSAMGFDYFLLFLFAFLIAPVLLLTLVAVAVPSIPLSRRQRALGVILPVLLVSIVWKDWPLCVSFAVHRPAMERLADQVQAGNAVEAPRQVGMFRVKQMRVLPNGNIGFQLSGDSGGGMYFVRRAANSTRVWYNTNWEIKLGGDWYYVFED